MMISHGKCKYMIQVRGWICLGRKNDDEVEKRKHNATIVTLEPYDMS
jgi:hypothetical protein